MLESRSGIDYLETQFTTGDVRRNKLAAAYEDPRISLLIELALDTVGGLKNDKVQELADSMYAQYQLDPEDISRLIHQRYATRIKEIELEGMGMLKNGEA